MKTRTNDDYPILIGITGRAGAGKDTLAEMLDMEFYNTIPKSITGIKSFAAPLKTAAAILFDLTIYHTLDRELKETPMPEHNGLCPRQMLQKLGSAVRKEFGGSPFINLMKNRIDEAKEDVIIIPDVRYQNEAEFILSYTDSMLIVIDRPGTVDTTKFNTHESEDGLCIPDLKCPDKIYHINNDRGLEDLKNLAKVLVAKYK